MQGIEESGSASKSANILRYVHKPDGALAALNASSSSVNGSILLGIIFVLVTALVLLTYFILFIYNRLRHPGDDLEDNDAGMMGDAPRSILRSEPQNQMILTKEDLHYGGPFRDSKDRLEADRILQKYDLERSEPKRRMSVLRELPSDGPQSDTSEGSYESVPIRRDSHGRKESMQELEGDDGPEQISTPSSDRPNTRSCESARYSREESQQDRRQRQQKRMMKIEADYVKYVEREAHIGGEQVMHQIDYSKYLMRK